MKTVYLNSFTQRLDNNSSDDNSKESFSKEIIEKNKEIREQHRKIIQETIDKQNNHPPKPTDEPKKEDQKD